MTPAILWALVALNGSTFDVEVGYTTAGECAFHVMQFLRPSTGMKAVRRIQSWSRCQDYLNPSAPMSQRCVSRWLYRKAATLRCRQKKRRRKREVHAA